MHRFEELAYRLRQKDVWADYQGPERDWLEPA